MLREIESIHSARPAHDGDGVALMRNDLFDGRLDPFLMLDQIEAKPNDSVGAFPVHPHRGIQTLSYIIHGGMAHKDSMGNASQIASGGIQWMHTGRGIEHSEIPLLDEQGLLGFQFWLNVTREEKFQAPHYQDMSAEQLTTMALSHAKIKLIAGDWQINQSQQHSSFNRLSGQAGVLDIAWSDEEPIEIYENATTLAGYVYGGTIQVNSNTQLQAGQLVQFSKGERVQLNGIKNSGLLIFKGEPIGETIVHRGPFVMTSATEIEQTIQAYRNGTLVY